ncbi:unnamed protein product [Miscanthus lutarioriparius]|uniref:Uncharacterized protein n=1 Tax=Miscanthus lutarioriparius TaxID=422564 RepID=A0A811S9E4_9POAL|nr:unnamed protein product [Miscanthus lutarioriparius]
MTMSRRILAWLLMVVVFVGSFAVPVRSSQEDGRSVWAAAAFVTAGSDDDRAYGRYRGGKIWNRRSLGAAKPKLPPAPVSNRMKAAAMPGPPSSPTGA